MRSSGTSSSNDARMARAEDEQHHDHQDGPDDPARREERQRRSATPIVDERDVGRPAAEHRVRDVAAVELADREQVRAPSRAGRTTRRTPSGACSASSRPACVPQISHDASLKSSGSPSSSSRRSPAGIAHDVRQRDADEQRRHRDDEAGDRAGDADVEQHALARNRLADADERAERAGQQRAAPAGKTAATRRRHNSGRRSSARARGSRGSPRIVPLYHRPARRARASEPTCGTCAARSPPRTPRSDRRRRSVVDGDRQHEQQRRAARRGPETWAAGCQTNSGGGIGVPRSGIQPTIIRCSGGLCPA